MRLAFDIPDENQHGNCYEVAFHNVMEDGPSGTMLLCHGIVCGQGALSGIKFPHAWNEIGNMVLDESNGNSILMLQSEYYSTGKIDPATVYKYNFEEMGRKALDFGTYGPWEAELDFDYRMVSMANFTKTAANWIKDTWGINTIFTDTFTLVEVWVGPAEGRFDWAVFEADGTFIDSGVEDTFDMAEIKGLNCAENYIQNMPLGYDSYTNQFFNTPFEEHLLTSKKAGVEYWDFVESIIKPALYGKEDDFDIDGIFNEVALYDGNGYILRSKYEQPGAIDEVVARFCKTASQGEWEFVNAADGYPDGYSKEYGDAYGCIDIQPGGVYSWSLQSLMFDYIAYGDETSLELAQSACDKAYQRNGGTWGIIASLNETDWEYIDSTQTTDPRWQNMSLGYTPFEERTLEGKKRDEWQVGEKFTRNIEDNEIVWTIENRHTRSYRDSDGALSETVYYDCVSDNGERKTFEDDWMFEGDTMMDEVQQVFSRKKASAKTATRQFTYAEMQELDEEIEGRELHNRARLKAFEEEGLW